MRDPRAGCQPARLAIAGGGRRWCTSRAVRRAGVSGPAGPDAVGPGWRWLLTWRLVLPLRGGGAGRTRLRPAGRAVALVQWLPRRCARADLALLIALFTDRRPTGRAARGAVAVQPRGRPPWPPSAWRPGRQFCAAVHLRPRRRRLLRRRTHCRPGAPTSPPLDRPGRAARARARPAAAARRDRRAQPDRPRAARHHRAQPVGDDHAAPRQPGPTTGPLHGRRPAMAQVSATGREAMAEMRRLLGVLRDGDGSDPAPAGPWDIEELLEQARRRAAGARSRGGRAGAALRRAAAGHRLPASSRRR